MQHQIDYRFTVLKKYVQAACGSTAPEELQSYLFSFGTVLICGNIERCVEIVVLHRLAHRAQPRVLNFIKSHFKRGNNYDCEATIQLLNRFEPDWGRAFGKFLEENEIISDGISSLYAVRNSVAHGGGQSVGSKRLLELYEVSESMIAGLIKATQ